MFGSLSKNYFRRLPLTAVVASATRNFSLLSGIPQDVARLVFVVELVQDNKM